MSISSKKDSCIPCGLHAPARNTYFDGKLLTSRDFQAEQDYSRGHRQMHNAMLHGTGVVCGLQLVQHTSDGCRDKFVILEPGMALDCCGQEIIVPDKVLVRVADHIAANPDLAEDLTGEKHLFIAIKRCDTGAEPLPVLLPGCDGEAGATENGRILEGYEVVLFARDPLTLQVSAPPTDPSFDWAHSFALGGQRPTMVASNATQNIILIGAQSLAASQSHINVHNAENHDLITQLEGPDTLGDIVVNNALGLIYASGIWSNGSDVNSGIGVWSLTDMRTTVTPLFVIPLAKRTASLLAIPPARLAISPVSGTLFALDQTTKTKAHLHAFSSEAISTVVADPALLATLQNTDPLLFDNHKFASAGSPFSTNAAMMTVSPNGRFLAITRTESPAPSGLYLINVAQLATGGLVADDAIPAIFDIPGDEFIHFARWSADSEVLYLATQSTAEDDDGINDIATIRRYIMTGNGIAIEPAGRGVSYVGRPLDLVIPPTETQAYLLLADPDDITRFVPTDIEDIKEQGTEGTPHMKPYPEKSLRIDGDGRNMTLTVFGDRMFVSADDRDTTREPNRGLVAVIDIIEANCDAIFASTTKGCATCADATVKTDDHAVILGHIPGFIFEAEQNMVDLGEARDDATDLVIDNATFRSIVPSATKISEVIACMLSRGIAEGPPGPRGEPGMQGQPGQNGVDGIDGSNGTDGSDGTNGTNGTDGTDGTNGTDGADGATMDVNTIIGVSWRHDQTMSKDATAKFIEGISQIGIAIAFASPINFEVMSQDNVGITHPIFNLQRRVQIGNGTSIWADLNGMIPYAIKINTIDGTQITDWEASAEPSAEGIGFRLDPEFDGNLNFESNEQLRVVLLCDFLIDKQGRLLDGTHAGGKLPTGQGLPGSTFRSWFSLAQTTDR